MFENERERFLNWKSRRHVEQCICEMDKDQQQGNLEDWEDIWRMDSRIGNGGTKCVTSTQR